MSPQALLGVPPRICPLASLNWTSNCEGSRGEFPFSMPSLAAHNGPVSYSVSPAWTVYSSGNRQTKVRRAYPTRTPQRGPGGCVYFFVGGTTMCLLLCLGICYYDKLWEYAQYIVEYDNPDAKDDE